jgi:hypothetical protein
VHREAGVHSKDVMVGCASVVGGAASTCQNVQVNVEEKE